MRPMIPLAAAAPLAEKSSTMMIRSRMLSTIAELCSKLGAAILEYNTPDPAAYEHAMAFDTKKYLSAKSVKS